MHHIEIYVGNLAQSQRFYSWLLPQLGFVLYQAWTRGFSYRKDSFYIVFVQTDDSKLQYGFNRIHVGINHLALLLVMRSKLMRSGNSCEPGMFLYYMMIAFLLLEDPTIMRCLPKILTG